MGKHDYKKARVEEMLDDAYPVTKICAEMDIPLGSIAYLLGRWRLDDKQIKRMGRQSQETREIWRQSLKRVHREGKTSGKKHKTYGLLRFRGEWTPQEDVRAVLEELIAQDMILAQMAEECGVHPRTITVWLQRFNLQQGIRKGKRCSWYRGGHQKYRGSGWLTIRVGILERDGHRCQHCGMTQEEARERGHGLSVHHLTPWRETHDNSPKNLLSLCQSCHLKKEWENGPRKTP